MWAMPPHDATVFNYKFYEFGVLIHWCVGDFLPES